MNQKYQPQKIFLGFKIKQLLVLDITDKNNLTISLMMLARICLYYCKHIMLKKDKAAYKG